MTTSPFTAPSKILWHSINCSTQGAVHVYSALTLTWNRNVTQSQYNGSVIVTATEQKYAAVSTYAFIIFILITYRLPFPWCFGFVYMVNHFSFHWWWFWAFLYLTHIQPHYLHNSVANMLTWYLQAITATSLVGFCSFAVTGITSWTHQHQECFTTGCITYCPCKFARQLYLLNFEQCTNLSMSAQNNSSSLHI